MLRRRLGAIVQHAADTPEAAAGAGDVAGLGLVAGQEHLCRLVPAQRALGVGEEMQRGVQPPHISSASQARLRAAPTLSSRTGFTRTDDTRRRPLVPVTVWPSQRLDPTGRGQFQQLVAMLLRVSTIAATVAPASARSKAVVHALSCEVATTTRSPTLTP